MSSQNEAAYIPKFVSKQVRSFCKRKHASHGGVFSAQRHNAGAGGAGGGGGGGAITRRNSRTLAAGGYGSIASLGRARAQQSSSIRESLGDGDPSILASTESVADSLYSNLGDLDDAPEIEETYGACAMIEIVGYSALIETLGQRGNVPTQLVTRSLESYFSKVIDIIEECRGDVVKILGDTLIVCWRCNSDFEQSVVSNSANASQNSPTAMKETMEEDEIDYFVGDSRELMKRHSGISDAVMIAVVCCMLCVNFLGQSEIWALEDISPEFAGLKFVARCAIGMGNILDVHMGVCGIRMENVLMGRAFNSTQECFRDGIEANDVAIHQSAYNIVMKRLEEGGIKSDQRGRNSFVLRQPDTGLSELQAQTRIYSENIVYGEVPSDQQVAGSLLESYITDGAAFYLRTLRKQRRGLMLFNGTWTRTALVSIRLKPQVTISVDASAISGHTGHMESIAEVIEFAKEAQRSLVTILKCCKKYNMIMHRISANSDATISVLCAIGGIWSGNEKEREQVAVKMAMTTRDMLCKQSPNHDSQSCFAIASSLAFESLLINRHRCDFRLVGNFINKIEELTRSMQTNRTILADSTTQSLCATSHIAGYFYPLSPETQNTINHPGQLDLNQLSEVAPRTIALSSSKTFSRMRDINAVQTARESIAFREEIEKINRACSMAASSKSHTTLLIEGSQGSGKTFLINRAKTILENMQFALCISEARENESFHHPLYPFTLLVPQLLDLIHVLDPQPLNTRVTEMHRKSNRSIASSMTGSFNSLDLIADKFKHKTGVGDPAGRSAPRSVLPRLGINTSAAPVDRIYGRFGAAETSSPTVAGTASLNKSRFNFAKFLQLGKSSRGRVTPSESVHEGNQAIDTTPAWGLETKQRPLHENVFKQTGNNVTSLSETLRQCLIKAGEDPEATLPLLNVVILPEIAETKDTKNLGPDGRTFLLASLIVRLIKKITESHRLAIIIDDVHWMDSASWQITMQIVRRCKDALVIMAASSTLDYRGTLLSQIKNMPQTELIELRGWSTGEVERYVQQIVADRVKTVNKDLVDVIKSQCEGTPAYIENMTKFIVEFNCISSVKSELVCNIDPGELEFRVPSSFAHLILWQYDSLRSKEFQKFLRCASVVGRYFSLEEVAAVWNETGIPDSSVAAKSEDFYGKHSTYSDLAAIVKVYDAYDMIEQRMIDEQYMDPNYPFRTSFAFRHATVQETIYNERMSEYERKTRHLKLIRFYERQLTDETEGLYIPSICLHYRGAGLSDRTSVLKRIQYLVMLGTYLCVVAEAFMETREIFNEINTIVNEANLEEDLGPAIISELHVRLGAAYSHGISEQISRMQGLKHLLIAINLLDYSWPKTDTDWWTMVWVQAGLWGWNNIFRISFNTRAKKAGWLMTALGRETYTINKYLDRLERLEPVLDLMSRHLFETDARLRDQIACDLLCLNVAFRLGRHVSKVRIRLLTSMALKFWFAGYLRLALIIAQRSLLAHDKLVEDEEDPLTFASSTSFLTACGRWSEARKWAIRGMEVCQRVGDLNSWLICSHQRCFMLIYDGRFKDALELEKLRGNESRMNGASFGALWSDAVVAQILLLQGDTMAAVRSRIDMDRHYKLVPPQLRAQFQGIFAQLELADGNLDGCLGCVERVIELIPKIHYSNNQVFYGVLLGVLAMYSMIERNNLGLIRPRRATGVQRTLTMRTWTVRSGQHSTTPNFQTSSTSSQANGFLTTSNANSARLGMSSGTAAAGAAGSPTMISNLKSNSPERRSSLGIPESPALGVPSFLGSLGIAANAGLSSSNQGMSTLSSDASSSSLLQSSLSLSVDRARIRRLAMTMITVLQPFQGHALCEPMGLLVRGLVRALDGSSISNLIDGPSALRDWAHKFQKNPEGDMRFMVGVLAMKSWRISGEIADWETEKRLAEQIFQELGIEGCLRIL